MDIIAMAAEALKPISQEGIPVKQGWYEKEVQQIHVTLWNLGDYESGYADDVNEIEIASIQVNIWSNKDQQSLKQKIIKLMKDYGFYYSGGNDELETESRIFINAMRFLIAKEKEDMEESQWQEVKL